MSLLEALIIWLVPHPGKLGCERVVLQFFRELAALHKHVIVGYDRHDVLVWHIVRDNYKVGTLQRVVLSVALIPKKFMPHALHSLRIELLSVLIADRARTFLQFCVFVLKLYIIKAIGGPSHR